MPKIGKKLMDFQGGQWNKVGNFLKFQGLIVKSKEGRLGEHWNSLEWKEIPLAVNYDLGIKYNTI